MIFRENVLRRATFVFYLSNFILMDTTDVPDEGGGVVSVCFIKGIF